MNNDAMDKGKLMLTSPVYLLQSTAECWKCHSVQSVVALAATTVREFDDGEFRELGGDDLIVLQNLVELPPEILEAIHRFHPQFQKRFSKTAECEYYMNTCSCGAHFGDFYLHNDPDSPFRPMDEDDAPEIILRRLPLEGQFEVNASYSIGGGSLILEYAKRVNEEG